MDSTEKNVDISIVKAPVNNIKVEINHHDDYTLSKYVVSHGSYITSDKRARKCAMDVLAN